ncbi:cytochrome P450 4d1-like [Scaptodrosophila lebanonensis]|uniref:Cytochrome P450 4d1-like n=1 Tax=Drosophila lebanonensis TaxID=7225 RepID=A0A6J2TAC8_DROLE|nr:cytochrome P450 4d1-like [Scaptodrosophila lebanonensis]
MFVVLLICLFLLALLCASWLYYSKYRSLIALTSDWPSGPSWPLIGHAHYFLNIAPERMFEHLRELYAKYGRENRLKFWFGTELNLFTGNVHDIAELSTSLAYNQKSEHYGVLLNWLGEGLLISKGEKWLQRRKLLTPAFHFTILKQFVEVFEQQASVLLAQLSASVNGEPLELFKPLSLYTLDVICETSMGVSIQAQTLAESDYVRAVHIMKHVTHQRLSHLFYHFDFTYRWTPLAWEERKALKTLHGFTTRIIEQRRAEQLTKPTTLSANGTAELGIKRKSNFLDILLNSEVNGEPLGNLDIREEVDTFIFEGYETTATALQFLFYNLATHAECQQRCYEELIEVFGHDPVHFEGLKNLRYIELCIKESLRLYPPVPAFARKVVKQCQLNGLTVPAGTNITVLPMYIGRLPEHFEEPDLFRPERFAAQSAGNTSNPFAFVPFSAGARNCVGQKFAMLEMKTVLVHVLRRFEFSYAGNQAPELMFGVTLCTRLPLLFHIKERSVA